MGEETNEKIPSNAVRYNELLARDGGAWEEMAEHLYRAGRKVACVKLRGEFSQDRDEIVAEGVAEFIRKFLEQQINWHQVPPKMDDMCAVVSRFVDNMAMRFLRRKNKGEFLSEDPADLHVVADSDPVADPEEISNLIAKLQPDPPVPDLVRGKFWDGYRNTELAERHGLNENTVASHLYRAMKKLREYLKESQRIGEVVAKGGGV